MGDSWAEEQIEEYKETLIPEDEEKLERAYEESLSDTSAEEVREELAAHVDREETHLELVTAAASAFHQDPLAEGYESGFRFAFTEPLHELNAEATDGEIGKTADLLLVKEEDGDCNLCLVECKTGQATPGWANELDDIAAALEEEEHRDRLLSQAQVSTDELNDIQYVLFGKTNQIHSLNEENLEEECDGELRHAFWGWDRGDQTFVHIHGLVKDPDLSSVVNTPVDAGLVENPIRFTLGEHPLILLRRLIEDILRRNLGDDLEEPMEFTYQDVVNHMEDGVQLGVVEEERRQLIEAKADHLIERGLQVEIFSDSSSKVRSNKDYRIMFPGKNPDVAREETTRKYLDWAAEEKKKLRAFKTAKEEFDPSQRKLM